MCGVIQVILQKFYTTQKYHILQTQVTPTIDNIMDLLLMVLNFQYSTVQEEALLVVSAICNIMNKSFNKYMQLFYPYLESCLKNYDELQICILAVGLLGDICLAIKTDFLPYTDTIMNVLWEN